MDKKLIPDAIFVFDEVFIDHKYWNSYNKSENKLDETKLVDRLENIIKIKWPIKMRQIILDVKKNLEDNKTNKEIASDEVQHICDKIFGKISDLWNALDIKVNFEYIFHNMEHYLFQVGGYELTMYLRMKIKISPKPELLEDYDKFITHERMSFLILNIFSMIKAELSIRAYIYRKENNKLKKDEECEYFWLNDQYPPYLYCYFEKDTDKNPNDFISINFQNFYKWFNLLDNNIFQDLEKKYEQLEDNDFAVRNADVLYISKNSAMWYISWKLYDKKADLITGLITNIDYYTENAIVNNYKEMCSSNIPNIITFLQIPLRVRAIGYALIQLEQFLDQLQTNIYQKMESEEENRKKIEDIKDRRNRYRTWMLYIESFNKDLIRGDPNDFERDEIIDRAMKLYEITKEYEDIFTKFNSLEIILENFEKEEQTNIEIKKNKIKEEAENQQKKSFNKITLILVVSIIFEIVKNLTIFDNVVKTKILNYLSLLFLIILIYSFSYLIYNSIKHGDIKNKEKVQKKK